MHFNAFKIMDDHCFGQQLFNNHKDQVIELIINKYLDVRFCHVTNLTNESNKIKLQTNLPNLFSLEMSNLFNFVIAYR